MKKTSDHIINFTWDNINNIIFYKNHGFMYLNVEKNKLYKAYYSECEICNNEFLHVKHYARTCGDICSHALRSKTAKECTTGERNGMYGRNHTQESIDKMSKSKKGQRNSDEAYKQTAEKNRGKKRTEETKKKLSEGKMGKNNPFYGKTLTEEHTKKISISVRKTLETPESKAKRAGENNPSWDGGYASNDIPKYDLYVSRLEPYGEECRRRAEDPNILEIRCTQCKIWFTPTIAETNSRIGGINSNDRNKFYCSPKCKQICPLYGASTERLMKQDAIAAGRIPLKELKNEVPGWIRDKVLELDDHTCQMCGSKDKLHVHHEIPQKRNQMLALDIENCVSVCIPCHVWVHTQIDGCRYHELAKLEIC